MVEDFGSSSFLKSLATGVMSAGLLQEMRLGTFGEPFKFADKPQLFLEHGRKALLQSVVQTGLDTAAQGGSFKDMIEKIGRGTVAGTVGGYGASFLGDNRAELGFIPHKIGHLLRGAFEGLILSRDPRTGLLSGMISGVTAETAAELFYKAGLSKDTAASLGEFAGPLTVYFTQGERGDISTAASVAHTGIENNFLEHLTNDELEEIEDPEALERTAQVYRPGFKKLHKTLEPAFQEIPFLEDWKQGILGGFDRAENFVQGHPFLAAGISSPLRFLLNPTNLNPIVPSCDFLSVGRGTVDLFFPTTPFGLALSVPIGKGVLLAKEGSFALRGIGKLDTRLNAKVFELVSREGSSFYRPHEIRNILEARYPGQITSTTVPDFSLKNVRLAGQKHPVTGIVFDQRGFPIFNDVMVFETKIAKEVALVKKRELHMRSATRDLKNLIIKGKVNTYQFTEKQISDIMSESSKIEGFTWHHHQDIGRMQLIPEEFHMNTGHIGGSKIWPFKKG